MFIVNIQQDDQKLNKKGKVDINPGGLRCVLDHVAPLTNIVPVSVPQSQSHSLSPTVSVPQSLSTFNSVN